MNIKEKKEDSRIQSNKYTTDKSIRAFLPRNQAWGWVYLDLVKPAVFKPEMYDNLVLPTVTKDLLLSTSRQYDKICDKDSSSCVYLLHGPPGVGKTFTAYCIAEVLQKIVYEVTAGNLGEDISSIEHNLDNILRLAVEWGNAIVLINEADIFCQQRTNNNLKLNGVVATFLTRLEMHRGIVFLTTNNKTIIDAAFISRISLMLEYEMPDMSKLLSNELKRYEKTGFDCDAIVSNYKQIDGRRIKNAVRMANMFANDRGVDFTEEHLKIALNLVS